jgi:lysyl-tRNA synthetase class 2
VLQNMDGVLETILLTLKQQPLDPPHPAPLPDGERERTVPAAPLPLNTNTL